MIITLLGLLIAAMQAYTGGSGIDVTNYHEMFKYILLGNNELNGMTGALAVSAWGGILHIYCAF